MVLGLFGISISNVCCNGFRVWGFGLEFRVWGHVRVRTCGLGRNAQPGLPQKDFRLRQLDQTEISEDTMR